MSIFDLASSLEVLGIFHYDDDEFMWVNLVVEGSSLLPGCLRRFIESGVT